MLDAKHFSENEKWCLEKFDVSNNGSNFLSLSAEL